MMRVVLDSNVIIAAFTTHGLCHLILENVLAHHEFLLSPMLIEEIQSNLKGKIKLPDNRVREIVGFLRSHAALLEDRKSAGLSCRDEDDIKVLALAVNENATVIVTGDQDLLVLQKVGAIPIVSPRDFWNLLRVRSEPG